MSFQPINILEANNKFYVPDYHDNVVRIYTDITSTDYTTLTGFKFNEKCYPFVGMVYYDTTAKITKTHIETVPLTMVYKDFTGRLALTPSDTPVLTEPTTGATLTATAESKCITVTTDNYTTDIPTVKVSYSGYVENKCIKLTPTYTVFKAELSTTPDGTITLTNPTTGATFTTEDNVITITYDTAQTEIPTDVTVSYDDITETLKLYNIKYTATLPYAPKDDSSYTYTGKNIEDISIDGTTLTVDANFTECQCCQKCCSGKTVCTCLSSLSYDTTITDEVVALTPVKNKYYMGTIKDYVPVSAPELVDSNSDLTLTSSDDFITIYVNSTSNNTVLQSVRVKYKYATGETDPLADDRLYVCDIDNHKIKVFNANDEFVMEFGYGYLNEPTGIAIDSDNILHVMCRGSKKVMMFNNKGEFAGEYGDDLLYCSNIKAIDDNTIYISETGRNRIVSFTKTDGKWVKSNPYVIKQFGYVTGINNMRVGITDCVVDFIIGDKCMYVTDLYNSKVVKWYGDNYENYEIIIDSGKDNVEKKQIKTEYPKGITGNTTTFYLADLGNNRILKNS